LARITCLRATAPSYLAGQEYGFWDTAIWQNRSLSQAAHVAHFISPEAVMLVVVVAMAKASVPCQEMAAFQANGHYSYKNST